MPTFLYKYLVPRKVKTRTKVVQKNVSQGCNLNKRSEKF